ncbi:RHS repeat domain-containing protein [Streptomyces alkaliterrae]|uniref:RHS repeat protein n=1 Tax=Streptomyces alkaliterrae TaxID=2213162 RepID=A0A5P0YTI5_9ACTN|nr:RHS repeat-associated core domain-containing protein [Streptomyces alkaliterrae]MBB1259520.1 RHS repeat protein [Streptomyces alkaliterrae]MQS02947.1 RHS repeat protein [Streptomyces alkaliterrae]
MNSNSRPFSSGRIIPRGLRRVALHSLTLVTATAVLTAVLPGEPVAAAERSSLALPGLDHDKPVPVSDVTGGRSTRVDEASGKAARRSPRASWPKAGAATVDLPAVRRGDRRAADKARAKARPGALPVELAHDGRRAERADRPALRLRVETLDRAAAERAGVDGVLLRVTATDRSTGQDAGRTGRTRETVDLTVDYDRFRDAYGGDWAGRLTLKRLPDCALDTSDKAPKAKPSEASAGGNCAPAEALPDVSNDVRAGRLAAPVTLTAGQPMLLAAEAAPSGSGGSFGKTSLSPSGSWSAGGSTGAFNWSYPLETPETSGGLDPELSLDYSSQAVDGRTSATNNQANPVGDGWTLTENFVERTYTGCSDDRSGGNNRTKTGDLCWGSDNATLSLGGESNELVRDDSSGEWRLKDDDGTRVARLSSTARGNGDDNGEYWRVTTTDGTRYYFGYNRLPGWSSGKPETNSTWTVPVYGNHEGEPCHKASFADSHCDQGWRWNLDYVVDPNGDAMAYYYGAETNRYARNMSAATGLGTPTTYVRGGHPLRIEYGLRSNDLYADPAARIRFTAGERCLVTTAFDCAPGKFTKENAKHWPDVPFDQHCASGDCKGKSSPSFWSRKKIDSITTEVRSGSGFRKVDSWRLRYQFPSTGDGSSPALWLAGVLRTGHTGTGDTTLPEVAFRGVQLPNRVAGVNDNIPPLVRYRVHAVDTESGGTLGVTYSKPDCTAADLPAETSNTRRCYPVYWNSEDDPAADWKPVKDWFHKYVVTTVLEEDNVGGAPAQRTDYTYLGGAAWVRSDDEFTKSAHRTHSVFRGYGHVRTTEGTGQDGTRQRTETRYFRGLPGAKVADDEGATVDDAAEFAGMTRAETVYDGDRIISSETSVPWRSSVTASRAREGLPALTARMTGVRETATREPVSDGGWRRTKTETTFDGLGMPVRVVDHGDTGRSGDETCTETTYARNTDKNIVETVATEKVTTGTCATTGELVSHSRTYYDGATSPTTAPTRGLATREEEQDAAGTGFWTVAETVYDSHGRPTRVTDAEGGRTSTAYTPATGGLPTRTVVTDPMGHPTTTDHDPARGVPTAETDANGKRTEAEYDGLGRLLRVWEPGWSRSANPDKPSAAYTYTISRTAPTVVASTVLNNNGDRRTSYEIYDGLLRERQTQMPAANGTGRVITETHYDSRGLTWKSYDSYYATGNPSGTLVAPDDTKVPSVTRTLHDGVGRVTEAVQEKYGEERTRTRTLYEGGDRTTVVPPAGGKATTRITDVHDRPVRLLEYTNTSRTEHQETAYRYDKLGRLVEITDPAGNKWTYTYDARGMVVESDDPDQGVQRRRHDRLGRQTQLTDSRGVTQVMEYDALGRNTALKEGDKLLADWSYDQVAKGELDRSRRLVDGAAYVNRITGFTDDYQPTGRQVVIPSAAGRAAGTYEWGYGYNGYTGAQEWVAQPAVGDVPAERVTTRYDGSDQATRLTAGGRVLVDDTVYDAMGSVLRKQFGPSGKRLYQTSQYDEHTGFLTRLTVDRDHAPQRVEDTRYGYDPSGNITRISTDRGQDAELEKDTQCFSLDPLQRLTDAWTATDDCAAQPGGLTAPKVGGPDAYWHSYRYDALGNRTREVRHGVGGAADTVRTYHYDKEGRPGALTKVTTTGAEQTEDTYGYDSAGNTTTRRAGGRDQRLTWDAEGLLTEVRDGGTVTSFVHDADGQRLLRTHDDTVTLYLPEGNELELGGGTSATGTRYYEHGDDTVAVRVGDDLKYLFDDHHGTATTAVDAEDLEVTTRRSLPFGAVRGAAATSWPGQRGFVGGTEDPTGLTQVGARAYDPELGRFISVDPLTDLGDTQRMNAYTYANNNPVTFSDDDGLFFKKYWKKAKKSVKRYYKKTRSYAKRTYTKAKKRYYSVKRVVKKKFKSVKRYAKVAYKKVKKTFRTYKKVAKKRFVTKGPKGPRAKPRRTTGSRSSAIGQRPSPRTMAASTAGGQGGSSFGEGASNLWDKTKNYVRDNKTELKQQAVHLGINIGIGIAAVAVGAAVCAGTAGVGCVVLAAAGVAAIGGAIAHTTAAMAMNEEITGRKAAQWSFGTAAGTIANSVSVAKTGSTILGNVWKGITRK